ncbi:restriction endonuclease subunit S [Pseudomonas amygdali]|uniref:restriction endonuclease subunit S n=1 Tax=Pseudomonas amygdali TaxID=47877 RepID=UPI000EFFBFFA|nr:restriction endonuclease subunit S [Pseudomonas amygdali]
MSKLPTGWATTTLGTIVEFKYGKALPATTRDGGDFPVFGSNGVVGYHSEWFSAAPTIVIGRKGSVGEVCFTYKNCSPIDTTYYIDSFDSINPKLCFYLLKTLRLGDLNKSTAIPGLNRQDAYNLEIQLPPFEEQMRIAQKLDELLAQVYTLKARIDAIPALLKRFRQSVLAASVSGRVTEEWRMAHASVSNEESIRYQSIEVLEPWSHTIEAPIGWTSNIFEDVIKLVGGSQPPKSEFIYEEAPELVRLIQIRDYKSDNHKVFIRRESTKKFCSADDIMIGRYGPPIFQILKGLEGAYNVALMKAVPLSGTLKNNYMYRYLQNYKILRRR